MKQLAFGFVVALAFVTTAARFPLIGLVCCGLAVAFVSGGCLFVWSGFKTKAMIGTSTAYEERFNNGEPFVVWHDGKDSHWIPCCETQKVIVDAVQRGEL